MSHDFDVCVIGSGAGGGPVAYELAKSGYSVIVLEKGPWLTEKEFYKDDLACCRRSVYTPDLKDEQHVIEDRDSDGNWYAEPTYESGWDFWNGNLVGGSSNLMSGFFYRMKPVDFHLLSEFGPIAGANIVDWPISYADLEPYYTKVESLLGVSGKVINHQFQEPRSTGDFPFPPMVEHPLSKHIDESCEKLGFHSQVTPRAILTRPHDGRRSCEYSGYCGSYGCASGAKGSSRAALLNQAVASGNCQIISHAKVYKLESDKQGNITAAHYYDENSGEKVIRAKIFVVACQAVETSRLLLSSTGPKHPQGLANNHNQVGKNLVFSAGGSGNGDFDYSKLDKSFVEELSVRGPFINRNLQDWYIIDNKEMGGRIKGGIIDFLLRHPNPIGKAMSVKWDDNGLSWGKPLKRKLESLFNSQTLRFEVFNDWLPTDDCFVSLDPKVKDKWNSPVAKLRIGYHEHDLKIGRFLSDKAKQVLVQMGAENIRTSISGAPPQNLMAGGCRFGTDIKTSVLDRDCKAHDVDNLYVTDGSFMPTGGSVTYTWTIYANSFRVADKIKARI
jgi:choline dehydrogenase-like flavoprotein